MYKFVAILVILVLIGGAFTGGYFLRYWQGPAHAANPVTEKAKMKKPPEWTAWQYPDSKEQSSGHGGGGTSGGVTVGPVDEVALTTPDDLDTVLKWYAKKFGDAIIAVPTGGGSSGGLSQMDSDNKDDPIKAGGCLLVSFRPDKAGMWRPVRMKVISQRTPRYGLVVNVSRADGEDHTHIVINYFPNLPGE